MRGAHVLLAALAAGATIVIAIAIAPDRQPPRDEQPATTPSPPPAAIVPATTVDATVPAPPAARPDDRLELPDGTFAANLNGATGTLSLAKPWGNRPWSPIDRIERSDAGVDWYVHEDGTRSTTEMKWRPDLGRLDAMVRIAIPQPNTPPVK